MEQKGIPHSLNAPNKRAGLPLFPINKRFNNSGPAFLKEVLRLKYRQ